MLGQCVGMMRGKRIDHRGERLLETVDGTEAVLQERSVEDAPSSVEIVVVVIFIASVILVETGVFGIHVEVHGAIVAAVEHGGAIAMLFQRLA